MKVIIIYYSNVIIATTHICRVHKSNQPKTIHKSVFPSIVVLVVHLRKFKCYQYMYAIKIRMMTSNQLQACNLS